jgi:GMP synthase-like glutamine amidotransferase
MLIVLGGPMSVNDEDTFPWLVAEKQFIRDAVNAGKSVLGICLGAQLIACTLGAKVYTNDIKEIGWFPIEGTSSGDSLTFSFPATLEVFHWHGETFDLPPDAIRLASSQWCKNQAFQVGTSVIGLQFHLETTPESVEEIISHCRGELIPSRSVQTERDILSATSHKYTLIQRLMGNILSYLQQNHR